MLAYIGGHKCAKKRNCQKLCGLGQHTHTNKIFLSDFHEKLDMVKIQRNNQPTQDSDGCAEKHAAMVVMVYHVREGHVVTEQAVSTVDENTEYKNFKLN